MKRHLKHLNQAAFSAVAAMALLAWTSTAHGQTGNPDADAYPVRAIRLVSAFSPGGSSDILARLLGQKLFEALRQPIVVENRPGAGGNIGAEYVAKSPPDGYTLLLANQGILATNVSLYRKIGFDPVKDFAPIILIASQANVLVVHPSLPVKSVKDLIALAKARPGQINYASSGSGASTHLAGELFNSMAGVKIIHIPYRGAPPALTDVMAGQVQLMFATVSSVKPLVDGGRLRALAVTDTGRLALLPDLPTVSEAGLHGYEARVWHAAVAPAATPAAVIARLNAEFNKALQQRDIRNTLSNQGAEPIGGTAQELGNYIRSEIPKWSKIIQQSGARAD